MSTALFYAYCVIVAQAQNPLVPPAPY